MIAVRLLARGAVIRESVYRDAPIRIGRGAENEFVIVDDSVSRVHALLGRDETGALWLEDLDSRNGLALGASRLARVAVPAQGVLRCRVGAVEIELAQDSTSDTLELRREDVLPHVDPPPRRSSFVYWLAGLTALIAAWGLEPTFWSPWKSDRSTEITRVAVGGAAFLPVAAFLAFGLLRVAGRHVRVADTMHALALFSAARLTLAACGLGAFYVLRPAWLPPLESVLATTNVVLFTAYLASLGRRHGSRRFFLVWTAALALLGLGLATAGHLARRQSGRPNTDYTVMVPVVGVTGPASSLDAYLEGLQRDFEGAAADAAEELRRSKARGR